MCYRCGTLSCFLIEENRKQVFIRVEVAESCGGWQEAILLCSSLMMQCSKDSAESELLCNHSSESGEECSLRWKHTVPELQGGYYWLVCECSSRTMLHKKCQEEINSFAALGTWVPAERDWKDCSVAQRSILPL